jgi:RNA ligase (TIGR02306 family)
LVLIYNRKRPEDISKHKYWQVLNIYPQIEELLKSIKSDFKQVILFGELYGKGIQTLQYGTTAPDFAAFDLFIDGKYIDYQEFVYYCNKYGLPNVPILDKVPFSFDLIKNTASGTSILGGEHIKEGVVVRPLKEQWNEKIGRLILKYVNDDYLAGNYFESEIKEQ